MPQTNQARPVTAIEAPEIGFVLDRSTSMRRLKAEAINGVATLVREQRNTNPQALFSLSVFNHENKVIHNAVPLAYLPELRSEDYQPGGDTALDDAIGAMIQQIGSRNAYGKVLITILTDGQENASEHFSQEEIAQMIATCRETLGWQFIFLGPKSATRCAASIGIPKANIVSFNTDPANLRLLLNNLSRSVRAYLQGDHRYMLALKEHNS